MKSNALVSHTSPSVAVCDLEAISDLHSACRVCDVLGEALKRVRIFVMFPVMSDLTGVKATEPRRSKSEVRDSEAERKERVSMLSSELFIGTSDHFVLRLENQV